MKKRLTSFSKLRADKQQIKQRRHIERSKSHHHIKKSSMSDKKKELLSLKRSLEQKKLLLSCERGDVQTLRSIINKYRDKRKNIKLLKSLLEYEDINNKNRTPLIYCCISGNVSCLLELLRNNINLEHSVSGSTALYHATSRGNIECVEELLIYGANPNALNHKGWTCLMNASYFGHNKIVELLLKYGANPDIQRKNYDNKCALHFAAKNGRYNVVQLLLQYGGNTNLFDNNDNMTALMYAVKNAYFQIVQLLILYGSNPYLKNKDGKCAIDFIQQTANLDDDDKSNKSNDNNNNDELFTFMQQSTHIFNAINKLIVPDTMRRIMKSLRKIDHIYPSLIAQLRSVSHMYQLGQSELDIHHFNNVICAQLHADLAELDPIININNNHHNDNDQDQDECHENVLDSFRKDIILCKSNQDRCEQNLINAQKTLKQIESDIIQTSKGENELRAQINLLQRQLKLCQNRQQQLKNKQISQTNLITNYKTSLTDLRHELDTKNKVFLTMDEASTNIRNVCCNANSIPLQHRRELQLEYKKKRKMLEESWSLWNLDDVITWICSLDPGGKFYRYKENLKKLKHLEDNSHKKRNNQHRNNQIRRFNKKNTMYDPATLNYDNFLMQHYHYDQLLDISDEYDGDEGKSEDNEHDDNKINNQDIGRKDIFSAEDIEGKDDYQNDIEHIDDIIISDADFADDDDEVAIADPDNNDASTTNHNHKYNKKHIDDSIHNKYELNEGQYNIQYSDSECSNNDKHGASEVIMSALMPKNDTTSDDDDDDSEDNENKVSEFDVDKLLDNIENIFDNLSNRDTDDAVFNDSDDPKNNDVSNLKSDAHKNIKSKAMGIGPKFGGSRSISSSSNYALSDGSYSGPDEPILESINNTVLKMCGIRDSKDRKIIMLHIETLRNGNSTRFSEIPSDDEQQQKMIADNNNEEEEKKENDDEDEYSSDDIEEDIPSEFICPITKQIMEDPVICSDGHSYERFAIEDWLVKHDKSPMTNSKLVTKQVFPNHSLRSMIALYRMTNQKKNQK